MLFLGRPVICETIMKDYFVFSVARSFVMCFALQGLLAANPAPVVSDATVFQESKGLLIIEAEHFYNQTLAETRAWHVISLEENPQIEPDGDGPHLEGASGNAYLEILPDSRRNHGEKLIHQENFSNEPGKLGVLHYRAHFQNPGRYYVWVRAFSTGSEDNGIHVGLNGTWPESGQRMQWCEGKRTWRWESKQRTQDQHCGEPYKIFLDVEKPGVHDIMFSMREDGFEFDQFLLTLDRSLERVEGVVPASKVIAGEAPKPFPKVAVSLGQNQEERLPDGDGSVHVSGERRQWHKLTLTLDGPFARETDTSPNPFTDLRMQVRFTHASGSPDYLVPGYFAADGNAAQTSAASGNKWRAHLSPDKTGRWNYDIQFHQGDGLIGHHDMETREVSPYHGIQGSFDVMPTNKQAPDFRAKGRLQYVGGHYLQFAGTGEYFLKAGADAPETFLGYADFDGTIAGKPQSVPLKTWEPHIRDWHGGDPTWGNGKGKGMIGALNYLSGKGCNVFSFLTYNAGGDGDNVWPFVGRDEKRHYDCSKLDQWGIVFDHATAKGLYLHFKLQETEMDDNRRGHPANDGNVPTSLDGGALGIERKLYCREMMARFGHALALNWNLGEENTQSTEEQRAMSQYIRDMDPYDHHIVVHTFPEQQDKVYRPLLGNGSVLTGPSLQNSNIRDTHWQVVKWTRASAEAGKPWVVAFDESGTAQYAQVPDLGYQGFDGTDPADGKKIHTQHEVRKYTLWGTLMGGGGGVEYYFGYKLPQNDLVCEDWRSRDQSWDYCRIALDFFRQQNIPFWNMKNADELIGNSEFNNGKYCLAAPGENYLIYLPDGGSTTLDLSGVDGDFSVRWFNPRDGGPLLVGSVKELKGGKSVTIGMPPNDPEQDWVAVIR
jgi:hypothetical protein